MRHLLLVLSMIVCAESAEAATLYTSPSGSGSTCSQASRCTNSTALSVAQPGDIISLENGTYTGSSGMLTWVGTISGSGCSAYKGGTAGNLIIIRAESDGGAIIDGQMAREPMRWACVRHVSVDGVRFQNSSKSVISINRSPNNTFTRISAYNGNYHRIPSSSCPGAIYHNYHVMEVVTNSNYVTVQDAIFGGTGRNLFNFFKSTHGILRRAVLIGGGYTFDQTIPGCGSAAGGDHGEPMQIYDPSDTVAENVIALGFGAWSGHDRPLQAGMNIWVNTNSQGHRNKYLGSIVMNYPSYGFYNSSACNTTDADQCSTDHLFENIVAVRENFNFYIQNGSNIVGNYVTLLEAGQGEGSSGSHKTGVLFAQSRDADKSGSSMLKNALIVDSTIGCYGLSDLQTGDSKIDYALLYNNGTDYESICNSRVTKTNITTGVNPALDSIAYVRAGSPALTAGEGGGRVGADTRCRYISTYDGLDIVTVHTNESLWPLPAFINQRAIDETLQIHGTSYDPNAIVLDHLAPRDTANLGCPTATGGGNPPLSEVSSQGTTSASYPHNLPATTERLNVCVGLYHAGSSVGSVTGVTSGGEALSLVPGGRVATSPAYRAVELWTLPAPTTGERTITVSTTGNADALVVTSMALENAQSLGPAQSATSLGTSPSLTVATNTNESVIDCLVRGSSGTSTPGANQMLVGPPAVHGSQPLRLDISDQDGADGGVMSWSIPNNYYAHVAISVRPTVPDPPSTATRTLTKYRVECGLGSESFGCLLADVNVTGEVSSGGLYRIRAEISGGVASSPSWGVHWYCRDDGGSYYRVRDAYNGHSVKWIGTFYGTLVPVSAAPTTQQLSVGNFLPGAVLKQESTAYAAPAMTATQKTELVGIFELTGPVDSTVQCRPHIDNGDPLDSPDALVPTVKIVGPRASMGF